MKKLSLVKILKEMQDDGSQNSKANLVFLIGPPATGKSTYIKTNLQGYEIINRDELVEKIASETKVGTYDDMFARPPNELKDQAGIPPDSKTLSEYDSDLNSKNQVDSYLKKIANLATSVPASEKYGELKPFLLKNLQDVIIRFGVKPEFINPFMWEKIELANEKVAEELSNVKNTVVGKKEETRKNFAIDMVNMSVQERNNHRKDILKILGEDPSNLNKVNDFYNQIAIVFAPEEGYTPELVQKIKDVALVRQEEIKASGGAKTIPTQAYDRMFASYSAPSTEEGFSDIKYVGVPSLEKLKDNSVKESYISIDRLKLLAGIVKNKKLL